MCGGTRKPTISIGNITGLSPRVRGNRRTRILRRRSVRSIPACAGEPRSCRSKSSTAEVYPRVCGGTDGRLNYRGAECGLSPRVRGNPTSRVVYSGRMGSIPACAGEPMGKPMLSYMCRVYPRVCGGTRPPTGRLQAAWGLSPRVRGNRRYVRRNCLYKRSIPACAGEPCGGRRGPRQWPVYPRVCGGTNGNFLCVSGGKGLSPRVRGNLTRLTRAWVNTRSIPACAGEPVRVLLP